MSSFSRIQTEEWLKTIDVKADRVLDIGGAQLPIKGRTKSWDVQDYKILDLAEPHECKQKPDYIADLNNAPTTEFLAAWISKEVQTFDVCFCIEVMEYLWNPVQALKNINAFLNPGGTLYLSYHGVYPLHKPTSFDFLRYSQYGIYNLLENCGFEVTYHRHKTLKNKHDLLKFYIGEGMRFDREDCEERILSQGGLIVAKKI